MSESRLLNLPEDILRSVLPNAVSDNDATKVLGRLSRTCHPLHQFFKLPLDELAARSLLTYVVQGEAEKAKKLYMKKPKFLFIESTTQEYAAGIDEKGNAVHRVVKTSPFCAMAGCGDIWMLQDEELLNVLAAYTDESGKSGLELAKEALAKHFPDGFDYPASTYNFKPLIDAITQDQRLIQTDILDDTTELLLTKFRNDFMPALVTNGHFFNLNDLVKTFELYIQNEDRWHPNQSFVFWCQVAGYLERLVTAVDAQVLSQGISNIDIERDIKRTFSLLSYREENITYFPLDSDHWDRLGISFGVLSNFGRGSGSKTVLGERGAQHALSLYVERKQRAWRNLGIAYDTYHRNAHKPSGCVML